MIEIAYLAGYFDADGSVAITRSTNQNGHRIHQIKATVTSVCPMIPTEFHNRWGGSLLVSDWAKKQNPNNRVRMDWQISSKKCAAFLNEIRPYLVFKADQVDVALKMQHSLQAYPGGINQDHADYEAVMEYRKSLYMEIRDMKKVHYLKHYWDGGELGENPTARKRKGNPEPSRT